MNSFDRAQQEVSLSGTNIFKLLPGHIVTPMRGTAMADRVVVASLISLWETKDTLTFIPRLSTIALCEGGFLFFTPRSFMRSGVAFLLFSILL
jgi:hypothetical protein